MYRGWGRRGTGHGLGRGKDGAAAAAVVSTIAYTMPTVTVLAHIRQQGALLDALGKRGATLWIILKVEFRVIELLKRSYKQQLTVQQ